jgi:hypothetical protein
VAGYRSARGIKIICRQGHRSKATVALGSLVHHVVVADDDIVRRKVHSAVLHHRLMFCGEEANDSATGPYFAGEDLRQLFVEALHPELVQVDLRQLSAEFPSRGGIKLHVRGTNGRLIRKWIGKVENFAPRHFHTPGFPEAEKIALSR